MNVQRVAIAVALAGLFTAPLVVTWSPGLVGASRAERLLPTITGSPIDPSENYTRMQGLFTADADLWGGAYVEDELLVVKVVGQTLDAAQRSLNAVGVTAGIKLVSSDVSLAALEAQQARVTKTLEGQESLATSWGPDYSTSSIVVGVTRPSARLEDILKGAADPDGPPVTTFVSPGEPVAVSGAHDTP